MVLYGTAWGCTVLNGVEQGCMVLHGAAWHCVGVGVPDAVCPMLCAHCAISVRCTWLRPSWIVAHMDALRYGLTADANT